MAPSSASKCATAAVAWRWRAAMRADCWCRRCPPSSSPTANSIRLIGARARSLIRRRMGPRTARIAAPPAACPAPSGHMVHTMTAGPSSLRVFNSKASAVYDQQVLGAIHAIDYAEDCDRLSATSSSFDVASYPTIEDTGRQYVSSRGRGCLSLWVNNFQPASEPSGNRLRAGRRTSLWQWGIVPGLLGRRRTASIRIRAPRQPSGGHAGGLDRPRHRQLESQRLAAVRSRADPARLRSRGGGRGRAFAEGKRRCESRNRGHDRLPLRLLLSRINALAAAAPRRHSGFDRSLDAGKLSATSDRNGRYALSAFTLHNGERLSDAALRWRSARALPRQISVDGLIRRRRDGARVCRSRKFEMPLASPMRGAGRVTGLLREV